jgi:hypothetical protein
MEEPGQLDVVYSIAEGAVYHVGEINVHIAGGDVIPHTKETVVLNRANIRHGDLVDAREIRNWERRLKASTLFVVNPQEGEPPHIKINQPQFDVTGLSGSSPAGTVRGQSPESPREQAQRLAHEQREHESRYGRSIYSWDGPRQSTVQEATQVQEAALRVPASQPRTSYSLTPR